MKNNPQQPAIHPAAPTLPPAQPAPSTADRGSASADRGREGQKTGNRRPIAGLFRLTARSATTWSLRRGIDPNLISLASIGATALSALFYLLSWRAPVLLLLAPLPSFVRLWFNMLDGMVAVEGGTASPEGEIWNELPDRISDFMLFGAVALSGIAQPTLAWICGGAALLVAYVGTLGKAVGAGRQFDGWMSKPWRVVALALGTWAYWWVHHTIGGEAFWNDTVGLENFWRYGPLDLMLVVILIGCIHSIAIRLRKMHDAL